MKSLLVAILIICITSVASADEPFLLVKKGVSFTPKEDYHCLNNDRAKGVIEKLRLCGPACDIRIKEVIDLKDVDIRVLTGTIAAQKERYEAVLVVKDSTIRFMEQELLATISQQPKVGWKIVLALTGGVALGAGVATAVFYAVK